MASGILQFAALMMLAGSLAGWAWVIPHWWSRVPLVRCSPRTPVPWTAIDLLVALFALTAAPAVLVLTSMHLQAIPPGARLEDLAAVQAANQLLAGSLGQVLALVFTLVWLAAVRGATAADFGLAPGKFAADLKIGVAAFLVLVGPVLAIQGLLTRWWPSTHPIIDVMRRAESSYPMLACGLAAVVVAPVVEELLFRAVLQGWLERLSVRGTARRTLEATEADAAPTGPAGTTPPQTPSNSPPAAFRDAAPYSPPRGESFATAAETVDASPEPSSAGCRPRWPIFASAAVFALAHFGNGPDLIPLFVLAVGLGYLYQRTHRVLPSIVVHFLLNAWSMAALATLVAEGEAVAP